VIAVDTSTWIAFLSGGAGPDADALDAALERGLVVLPPIVLTELMSDPKATKMLAGSLQQIPLLSIEAGYWERAGQLRAKILSHGLRARLADALIAQSCVDHQTPLLTGDSDFRHFARWGGLNLLLSDRPRASE
jgi:predicted nucleic acid-binding protein